MADSRWRIAVTGIGLVTPLGLTAAENVTRVLDGESAGMLRPATEGESVAGVAYAGVPPFDLTAILRNPKNLKLMSRPVKMALLSTREAVDTSRVLQSGTESEHVGVYVGSGQTGLEYDEFFKALTLAWEGGREEDFKFVGLLPARTVDRYFSLRTLANAGVGAISTEFGARGPSNNYVQGETAGAVALDNACQDLLEDRCDAAVVCAYESLLVPSMMLAFRKMKILSGDGFSSVYTPFNAGRPGIVLGEGAGCLILERSDTAQSRGAEILGFIDGVGLASQIADEPGLTADAADICFAAQSAANGAPPDFIVARGLGTLTDDRTEAEALRQFVGASTPITAFKGSTGYLGAATAAIELGLGLLCARKGFLPPVHGLVDPDGDIGLPNLVQQSPVALTDAPHSGLFFSSTFGGQVAAISATSEVPRRG